MKLSWTYLLQFISASLLFTRVATAPTPEPEPNRAIEERHGNEYLWYIDEAESNHLGELLGVDFRRLGITGVILDGPKMQCEGCGKYAGLDDFVHNALEDGVHSKDFMLKVLEARGPNPSPPHLIRCSAAGCGRTHVKRFQWDTYWIV